jgi:hypothetical protein
MRAAAAAAAAPAAVAVSSGSRDDAPSKLQLADKLEEAAVNIGHLRQLLVQETAAHTEAARSAAEAQHELDRYQRVPIRTRNTTLKYCRHDEILLARSQCSVI